LQIAVGGAGLIGRPWGGVQATKASG
jgi:hypothetical protein